MKMRAHRGSILMEYVILLVMLVLIARFIVLETYDFQSSWGGSFGSIGTPVVHLYQRLVTMISLPFP